MRDQTITNPAGAYRTFSDFRTGKDTSGEELPLGQTVETIRANATITKGDAVYSISATQTVPPSVEAMPIAGPGWRFVGIAKKAAVAGDFVEVVTEGYALARVAAAVAANAALTFSGATAGVLIAVVPDATTIVGAVLGRTLAASQDPALTPIWVRHV